MKHLNFTYTKADGSESERSIVQISAPSTMIMGLDVSELDNDDFAEFLKDYRAVLNSHQEALQSVYTKYDLVGRIRQFKPGNITNLEEEWL